MSVHASPTSLSENGRTATGCDASAGSSGNDGSGGGGEASDDDDNDAGNDVDGGGDLISQIVLDDDIVRARTLHLLQVTQADL